ncbi:MAG: CinA family protein [Pseudomonadota bacterium]
MFDEQHLELVRQVLDEARAQRAMIATAESCTGGLIAALLTEIPGSSDVVDRGFVTYTNEAKRDLLDVRSDMLDRHGAVSEPVARQMALGAIAASSARFSVAVTGIAGPGGGSDEKPVGLVHIAIGEASGIFPKVALHERCTFGDLGRTKVRMQTVEQALTMLLATLKASA